MNRVLPPTSVWDRFSLVSRSVMNASNSSFFHDGLLFSASLIIEQGRHGKSTLVHWSQRESLGLAHEIPWAMANMAELHLLKVISSCCRALMLSNLLCRNPFPYSQFLLIRSAHATVVGVGPPLPVLRALPVDSVCFVESLPLFRSVPLLHTNTGYINNAPIQRLIYYWDKKVGARGPWSLPNNFCLGSKALPLEDDLRLLF